MTNPTPENENLDVETPEDETPETPGDATEEPTPTETPGDAPDAADEQDDPEDEAETFDRPYVERLRRENAEQRVRARRADDLAAALWSARVAATGRLADPTDLTMPDDADPLDAEAVTTAIDELLERKPHLASRRPTGDVGQGAGGSGGTVDLAGIMRGLAS